MLTALSALVAALCALACMHRLACAVSPAWLDPGLLADALKRDPASGPRRLGAAVAACARATWERDLWSALDEPDETARVAMVNEQLRELEWLARRWQRAPRVCASVATSAGFLFACLSLVRGLGEPDPSSAGALVGAVDALVCGVASTFFCVAVHLRAKDAVRARLAAADRLVELLESAGPLRSAGAD